MEKTNSKTITVSLMAGGILVGITFSVLIDALAAIATGPVGRFLAQDWVRHGLPVVAGLAFFLSLQFNKTALAWADEVVTEISRVVWPSRHDTMAMTIAVCIMLLISGIVLGILDVVSGTVIDWLLQLNVSGLIS